MKKAVMYGAGNIGRGFIGQLFSMSGYETVFIDINEVVINKINADKQYPIYIAKDGQYTKTMVDHVRAVNGRDIGAVADEIASADIMATAVGVNVLPYIAAPLAQGIAKRAATNAKPLDIIICENLLGADKYLAGLIGDKLTGSDKDFFTSKVGLVEASIGRMVPATPADIAAENALTVCVEEFCTLPVDKAAFKGEIPAIQNLYPFTPFELFIERKLFMHNMSHAMTAYLGYLQGLTTIAEAIAVPEIKERVREALMASAHALAAEHHVELAPLMAHAEDLLVRYTNVLLGDTIERVGKDPIRKLSNNDRLVGALRLCLKHNIDAKPIMLGIAAGLLFAPASDAAALEVSGFAAQNGVAAALAKYSGIEDKAVVEGIEAWYGEMIHV